MSRPVHYASSGQSLAFPCYWTEMKRHLASCRVIPAVTEPGHYRAERHDYPVPSPRKHSNLGKVTCRECWTHIAARAALALGSKEQRA
jgi:hypothetical protein